MDLQQRVERLERENRRLKLVGIGLLLLAGVIAAWQVGFEQPQRAYAQEKKSADYDTVIAKKLVIKDDTGRDRIVLEAPDKNAPDGTPLVYVRLNDEKGYPTNGVLQFKSSAEFWASRYSTGESFITVSSYKDGSGVRAMNGRDPSASLLSYGGRASVQAGDQGGAALSSSKDGQTVDVGSKAFFVFVDKDGKPTFRVQDKLASVSYGSFPSYKVENNVVKVAP